MPDCKILIGDCLESMRAMPDNSVDSIVTDPPYGLSFMGKKWDYDVPSVEIWAECLRVLKPGGHLLAFAGTRTQHRMACRIEDAGFEIRDMIAWVYGSGFPKSLDVSKAIDNAAGAERTMRVNERWADRYPNGPGGNLNSGSDDQQYGQLNRVSGNPLLTSDPVSPAAQQWQGWGTALKPALEPITVARKPLAGTVAANVLTHGTGGINVDGCRVEITDNPSPKIERSPKTRGIYGDFKGQRDCISWAPGAGRWPANLIHDGSEDVAALFPETKSGAMRNGELGKRPGGFSNVGADKGDPRPCGEMYGDSGSAARFFYCAKASKADRGIGNNHPTVKPNALMRYLCRLVTPPGGTVLDPFAGSGSTGKAALQEGFSAILCELNPENREIIEGRTNVTPGLGI